MIKNQWYVVLESKEVKAKPLGATRFGEKLVFWRDKDNKINCIGDKCVHRGVSLCKGQVVDGHIQCPFHGFEFDGSGKCVHIPANGRGSKISPQFKGKAYECKEEYGYIWVFYGDEKNITKCLPYFEDLKDGFTYHTIKNHWNVHYSRVIENQLDVVHLPFIHGSTIGKGEKYIVNGPLATLEDDLLTVMTFNVEDKGQAPLKTSELSGEGREQKLLFKFPHVWQNLINEKIRITIAFVPIDDENTLLYLRFYQSITKIPVLAQCFNLLGSLGNHIIQNQDKVVVETQIPKKSGLAIGEKLILGDKPIVMYRKKRAELQNDALENTIV